jgi:hypothetical protein
VRAEEGAGDGAEERWGCGRAGVWDGTGRRALRSVLAKTGQCRTGTTYDSMKKCELYYSRCKRLMITYERQDHSFSGDFCLYYRNHFWDILQYEFRQTESGKINDEKQYALLFWG